LEGQREEGGQVAGVDGVDDDVADEEEESGV
jgi:hypothetical protein